MSKKTLLKRNFLYKCRIFNKVMWMDTPQLRESAVVLLYIIVQEALLHKPIKSQQLQRNQHLKNYSGTTAWELTVLFFTGGCCKSSAPLGWNMQVGRSF